MDEPAKDEELDRIIDRVGSRWSGLMSLLANEWSKDCTCPSCANHNAYEEALEEIERFRRSPEARKRREALRRQPPSKAFYVSEEGEVYDTAEQAGDD